MAEYTSIDISGHTLESPVITFEFNVGGDFLLKDNSTGGAEYNLTDGYRHIYVTGDEIHVETYPAGNGLAKPKGHATVSLELNTGYTGHIHLVKKYIRSGFTFDGSNFKMDTDKEFTAIIGTDDLRYADNPGGENNPNADELALRVFDITASSNDIRLHFDGTNLFVAFKVIGADVTKPLGVGPIANKLFHTCTYRTK